MNCSGFIMIIWKIQAERQITYAWLRRETSVRHTEKYPKMRCNIGKKPIIPGCTIWGWKQAKIKVTPCDNNGELPGIFPEQFGFGQGRQDF